MACSGCVGTSDIATNAVTTAKIGSGQVSNSDLGTGAVTTGKISDTNGVYSADIVNGQVKTADLASDAVSLVVTERVANKIIAPGTSGAVQAYCLDDEVITGGGFHVGQDTVVKHSSGYGDNAWNVNAINPATATGDGGFAAFAECAKLVP